MLCVLPAGLQPPSATLMFFIRLLSWLHCAFLAASSLTDCFRPASCTSAIIGAYALRSSLLLVVWLRCRFIQAAIALSLIQSSVALLLMLVVGFRCVFCFDFCFLFPRSLTLDRRCFSMSSLRPSSLSGPSPCIYPAGAYWLPMPLGLHWASSSARFSYYWWKVRCSKPLLIPGLSRCHRRFGRMP